MFSPASETDGNGSKCSSPVPIASTTMLNELDDSLKKLTIDKRIQIKLLSAKSNPFKARKKTSFKEFSNNLLCKHGTKGLEEITEQMDQLWCSDGYRESFGSKKKVPVSKDCSTSGKSSLLKASFKSSSTKASSSAISSSPPSSSTSSSSASTSKASSDSSSGNPNEGLTCARQANCDYSDSPSVNELAAYFEEGLFFPKKMSFMAEMMYT